MTEEFNLSERIVGGDTLLAELGFAIRIEDVKEFIRRLKEEIKEHFRKSELWGSKGYLELIDKLAGEKLSKWIIIRDVNAWTKGMPRGRKLWQPGKTGKS